MFDDDDFTPAPPPIRADKRNVMGGPKRNGNQNPGQGQDGRPQQAGAPKTSTIFKEVFDEADDEGNRAAGRRSFKEWMNDEKREEILTAMHSQAKAGNVMAARLILGYDMGLPTVSSEVTDKTPLKGADVHRAITAALDEQKANGVDTSALERNLFTNGIAPLADDGPQQAAP